MWEPLPLTTLWAFMACYSDSFTFVNEFINYVSSDDWKVVYNGGDVNTKLNSFLNTLKIFVRSFPFKMDKTFQNFESLKKLNAHISTN
jgi:hypothetical protein